MNPHEEKVTTDRRKISLFNNSIEDSLSSPSIFIKERIPFTVVSRETTSWWSYSIKKYGQLERKKKGGGGGDEEYVETVCFSAYGSKAGSASNVFEN